MILESEHIFLNINLRNIKCKRTSNVNISIYQIRKNESIDSRDFQCNYIHSAP